MELLQQYHIDSGSLFVFVSACAGPSARTAAASLKSIVARTTAGLMAWHGCLVSEAFGFGIGCAVGAVVSAAVAVLMLSVSDKLQQRRERNTGAGSPQDPEPNTEAVTLGI